MKVDWKFIDKFLMGEMESDDCSIPCKKEIAEFLQTHDFEIFSDESLDFLSGVWNLVYKDEYQDLTGQVIPNIFKVIHNPEEPEPEQEVNNEQEPLSSGI